MATHIEFNKKIPVVLETDVIVAGGGLAGSVAAITAARNGGQVVVVDRFGYLGGNIGPGMFSGGTNAIAHGFPNAMPDGLKGIAGEVVHRCEAYCDGLLGFDYFRDSQAVAYVLNRMMEENGVKVLLNTFVVDPIMNGKRITGLVVENKSGSQAIKSKTVIDATGDADVASRAGAPMDLGEGYSHPGMYFAVGDVDTPRYLDFLEANREADPVDVAWAEKTFIKDFGLKGYRKSLDPFLPYMRQEDHLGSYHVCRRIADIAVITVDHGFYPPRHNIVGSQVGLEGPRIHSGDAWLMSELERGARTYIFDTARFLRRRIPGFENSYLHMAAPYFHARGGRSAVCEYNVTADDVKTGARHDDVTFIVYGSENEKGPEAGSDFPYRQFIPKGVDGLLTAGRSTIIQPPTMRTRWKVFMMGQVAGLAAALAARDGCSPRDIDVKEMQKTLVTKYQAPLGSPERQRELGLA